MSGFQEKNKNLLSAPIVNHLIGIKRKMGENKRVIDLKKRKLKEELKKPKIEQNHNKIRRLRESIERHKRINKSISRKRRRK